MVHRGWVKGAGILGAGWVLGTLVASLVLPNQLLHPPSPGRSAAQIRTRLEELPWTGRWTTEMFTGPDGARLHLHWLHRPRFRGVILCLHGFGDDAVGTIGYAGGLSEWDAATFTFRGREEDPTRPCTLGAREMGEVVAAVHRLEGAGVPRSHIFLLGVSQGAGVVLLALRGLEQEGGPLGGALLESPFRDLRTAAKHHVRGLLGVFEPLARPAERLALTRAGRLAGFDPERVSPLEAAETLTTPLHLLAGDADAVTPLKDVQEIAGRARAPLTVVRGAGHCEAGAKVPGGWEAWARSGLGPWRESEALRQIYLRGAAFPGAPGPNLQ